MPTPLETIIAKELAADYLVTNDRDERSIADLARRIAALARKELRREGDGSGG